MGDGRWMDPIDTDAYHGQIHSKDGRSFWVMPRLHRSSGWFVEVRADSPDGELLERRWKASYRAARVATGSRRAQFAHLEAREITARPTVIDALRDDLGLVVAHGPRGGGRGYTPQAVIDGQGGNVCWLAWAPSGRRVIRWSTRLDPLRMHRRTVEIDVEPLEVVHLWRPSMLQPHRVSSLPPWHLPCAKRSLRFVDGQIAADRDVRTLLARS